MPKLNPHEPPPPDYYAGNLRVLLEHVGTYYGDLLEPAESRFIDSLLGLETDAQRLYARLLSRKGPWIRVDKLDYREIADHDAAIAELEGGGLVRVNEPAPADVLLGLLTQGERAEIFPDESRAPRTEWITRCVTRHDDGWIRRRLARRHSWISLSNFRHMQLCQLLFFGDDRQDTSAFVLQDLGLIRFEPYTLDPSERMFADRAALDRFRRLRRLSALSHRLDETPELAAWLVQELACEAENRHEQRQRDRSLNRLGLWFERRRAFDEALAAYGLSGLHPSRERRARMLARLGDEPGARALTERIAATPRCAEEVDFSRRFGRRQRRATHQITELPLSETPESSIEAHAAGLLGAGGAEVFHIENAFPLGLAGLAFWDVVFEELPGAFVNPFQNGPLDLFWPDFAQAREAQLTERARQLAEPGALVRAVRGTYAAKHGIANRLVSWRHFTPEVLDAALNHIDSADLLNLASHVIRWPYRTRNGFPDLVVIYGRGNHEFVEVKGPTDQLQPAQRVWLKALGDMGQRVRVLKFKAC